MEKVNLSPSVSIVTVTYTGDKWPMLLQAHSIEKFVKEPTTHYVIIEDQSGNTTSTLEWLCLLQPIYKKHRLVLLDKESAPELFLEWDKGTVGGWDQQQYIKLKIHELVDTQYYLTLDSKNFFMRPTSLIQFYGHEGCDTIMSLSDVPQHPSLPYWFEWMNTVEEITGKPRPENFWFAGTPFNLKTDIVKEIFNYNVEQLFLQAINNNHDNVDKRVAISEYILYAYFSFPDKKANLCWSTGYGPEIRKETIDLLNGSIHCVSRPVFTLHRNRLQDIQHRNDIIQHLIACGLDSSYVIPAIILDRKSQGH
jgi:hypothetical protein